MSQITEYQVVDNYFELALVNYANDAKKIDKGLTEIFSNHGLELKYDSEAYKTIKLRYGRILKKILDNNRRGKSKYNSFKGPEKLFFSAEEFPDLCKNEAKER